MRITTIDRLMKDRDPDNFDALCKLSFKAVSQLSTFYPQFDRWYEGKVAPGLSDGSRNILLHYIDKRLAGIAILKNTHIEKKLCCLRVLPEFQGSGVGLKLFYESFNVLETDKPLLSVSEETYPRFRRIFDHFSFEVGARYENIYRKNKTELSFNGSLNIELPTPFSANIIG